MSDRRNKPSASGLEYLALCPGKLHAEAGLPEIENKDAKDGTAVHDALAGIKLPSDLTSDQQTAYEDLRNKCGELVEELGYDHNRVIYEERLWFKEQFSGQCDRIYLRADGLSALVVDFKSGWASDDVTPANANAQLACLCVLAFQNFDAVEECYAAIIPRIGKPTLVRYSREDSQAALQRIHEIIADAEKDNAPRVPGEKQCRYCRARFQCPERLATTHTLEPVARMQLPAIPSEALALYLDKLPTIKKVVADLEAEAKARLSRGESVPGYRLHQGNARERIVALPTICARAQENHSVTVEEFTAACSLTKKAAKELLARKGLKGKALDNALAEMIDGCTELGEPPEPSLEKEAV